MQETTHKVDESPRGDSPPSLLPPPNLIRLNVTLTADQYAVLEAALHKMQRRKGKRASTAVLLTELASQYLAQGDARSKVAHPVVVNVVAESGEAFYATERGCYTVGEVSSEVMVPRQAEKKADVHVAEEQSNHRHPGAQTMTPTSPRRGIPQSVKREAFRRAGWRCEKCRSGVLLEMDHVNALVHGGTDDINNLQVLCHTCHDAKHLHDYQEDLRFQVGRARAMSACGPSNFNG